MGKPKSTAKSLVRKGHPKLDPQIAKLRKAIAKAGLAERTAAIEGVARWSVRMVAKPSKKHVLGASRIGGEPDLPPDVKWPMLKKQPLVFAAQVRFEDASAFDVDGLFPNRGLMSVFIDPGYEDVAVMYFDDVAKLVRRAVDTTEEMGEVPAKPCTVTFRTELSLPPTDGPTFESLDFDDDELDTYNDDVWLDHVPDDNDPHRLLGYPAWSMNPSQKRGVELLIQVGSDDNAGMCWGDAQPAFVFIPQKALARRDFAEAFLSLDG